MKITLNFLLSAVILAVSVSAVPPVVSGRGGHLRIIDAGENTLEAIFYSADTGIRIRADSVSLTLVSMGNDEVLLSGTKPHGSSLLASVMGASLLVYNATGETGENRKIEFVVPESLVDQTKNALAAAKDERMISQLDRDETQAYIARESAFQRLFEQPEIALLESAARALGDAGIMGYENQGALNFYGVAKALLTAQHRAEEEEEKDGNTDFEAQYVKHDRAGRFKWGWFSGRHWCWNSKEYCYRCPVGDKCRGRCGPGCWWCWSFLCDSCCYQQGCYDHDICCRDYGYLSTECLIPIPFRCSGYNC